MKCLITCSFRDLTEHSSMSTFLDRGPFWPSLIPGGYRRFRGCVSYFDIISQWVMNVFSGKTSFRKKAMRKWCAEHMASLHVKRFYDSWLETIRIGLLSGLLPDPARDFSPDTGTSSAVWSNLPIWPLLPHFRSMV